ncbi:hypothetical protein NP233_g6966 [Leucocoprinus birnbaumii]|uniref:Uncharacterized protein n=1 Tax=Leucocoprinus birnbaumii TaxID=56174 RepID=A0AAD5YV26_9AGAR|nr:hypothetical protein NP233_g6966 [Leucocoprinus birnbaumii]
MPYTSPTEAQSEEEEDDWMNYYVNIFVDRDMYLRYIGLGIGHQAGTTAGAGNNDTNVYSGADSEDADDMAISDDGDEEMIETGNSHEAESDEVPSESESMRAEMSWRKRKIVRDFQMAQMI